ncbi:unnamed protein product [Porites evermanni]|uniref:Uncharacterized protein n=1 Tax=Porites evermanni TaxID=104178 RepID=A0ABN8QRM8_9CNID|nr:unnamed protein product [Porites evermanni]
MDPHIRALMGDGLDQVLVQEDKNIDLLTDNEDKIYLAAYRRFEQRGGNPIFRAEFAPAGRGRQLRDADGEGLGEALMEVVMQGLRQVVTNKGIEVADYLIMAVHSNSFQHVWQQSLKNIPLAEWLSNSEFTQAWMEQLAKRLNSGEVMNVQQDGFFVELTFFRRLGRGGKNGGKKGSPGRMAKWCNRNEAGNRWSSLRRGRPQLGFLAMELHREAGVPEGTCGYAELEKF